MMRNLQDYPMTVLRERIWHFRGSKHTLTPSYTYSGGQDLPTPRIYAHNRSPNPNANPIPNAKLNVPGHKPKPGR